MSKKIISDIIITKRSIRQIPIAPEKKQRLEEEIEEMESVTGSSWQRKPMNPRFLIWLISGVCILALFFGLSMFFSSATIVVTPRTEKIVLNNDTYTAKSNSAETADLYFEVMKISDTVNDTVPATEEKDINQKATGKIVIYNSYSTVSQRLINNTRFEANNGKMYRISSSVIVPGYKKVNGKVIPGSIEATVYADQAGEAYNLKMSDLTGDFKIPGFKGEPRYTSMYARIKTDIIGGLVGKQRIVGAEIRKSTEEAMKIKLREQLLKELYAVKPESFILFKDAYFVSYNNLIDTPVDSDKVTIGMEGVLNAIVFNNLKLSKFIATKKLPKYDGLPAELVSTDNLSVNFVGADSANLWKNSILQVKFNGEATLKWVYDADLIKKSLVGKKEAEIKNTLVKFKDTVRSLQIIFKPVWTMYLPDDISKIKLKEVEGSI